MVWLDICDEQGNTIYFDIHHVERRRSGRRWQHSVHGICGNGLFEIEVLVEPAGQGEVTYIDLSSGAVSGHQLLSGIDPMLLESGLLFAARRHCGLDKTSVRQVQMSPHLLQQVSVYSGESGPVWQQIA